MMFTLFRGTTGLNNKVDPVRIEYDEDKMIALSECLNVEVGPTGRISRQKGTEQIVTGNFHSLCPFDCGGYTLAVKDNNLVAVDTDGNSSLVRSGITSRLAYEKAHDGMKDFIYYTGDQRGKVYDRTHYPWELTAYSGPTTQKPFSAPPDSHLLTLFNGRMYLASGNTIFPSEIKDYHKYVLSLGMQFRGRIRMLKAMETGIYVSDDQDTYFIEGHDVLEPFVLKRVGPPAIEGCYKKVDADYLPYDVPGQALIWLNDDGVYVGFETGQTINTTKDRLAGKPGSTYLPSGTFGAMVNINNERIILTIGD